METANIERTTVQDNTLMEWVAPSRPFKKRTQEFYRTMGALVLLFVIILLFSREILLTLAVLALAFLMYVLSTVPPEQLKNRITNLGIHTGEHFHRWEEMAEFWFDTKYGEPIMVVRLHYGFPTQLQLLLPGVDQIHLKKVMGDKIPFQEKPLKSSLDKASEWLVAKFPLERTT